MEFQFAPLLLLASHAPLKSKIVVQSGTTFTQVVLKYWPLNELGDDDDYYY